jgi:ParB/Sulfiredoxin domain
MSEIRVVSVASIDSNPLRKLKDYPFNEKKLEALMRSVADVGLWEGVIAREHNSRYQLAFGHHRVEAARRQNGKTARIPIIVRALTDEQMIQFMGRENLEDYNADFFVMLEAWEASLEYLGRDHGQKPQDLEIARLLGWIEERSGSRKAEHKATSTALACSSAYQLIQGGYLKRVTLEGLSVFSVREICGRIVAQHEMLEKMAKNTARPPKEIEAAKKVSGKAGERTARDVKAGRVSPRNIRGTVDTHAYRHAREAKQQTPLFAMFGKQLIELIRRCALDDAIGEKLREIKKSMSLITTEEDLRLVKGIAFECEGASERFAHWQKAFTDPKTKVVPLKAIGKS